MKEAEGKGDGDENKGKGGQTLRPQGTPAAPSSWWVQDGVRGQDLCGAPVRDLPTYLFLPADIADDRAGGWAGGRSQDAYHPFRKDLAHCG